MATNRPSLLDDEDLASFGSPRANAREAKPGRARVVKLSVAIALFIVAGGAATYSFWAPDPAVRGSDGRIVESKPLTEEDHVELKRQDQQRELFLQQGGLQGSE